MQNVPGSLDRGKSGKGAWSLTLLILTLILILAGASPAWGQGSMNLEVVGAPTLGASVEPAVAKLFEVAPAPEHWAAIDADSRVSIIVTYDDSLDLEALVAAAEAQVIYRYQVVLDGVSLVLPRNQVELVSGVPGVTGIYFDRTVALEASPDLDHDLPVVEPDGLEGVETRGESMVVGIVDTGIWPEHPSFSDPDPGREPYWPSRVKPGEKGFAGGISRSTCDLGSGAATCNNKLIAAYQFLDTYRALAGSAAGDPPSARDDNGHGTYVASRVAGNVGVAVAEADGTVATLSGIAPRAQLAIYRAAFGPEGTAYFSDLAAAIEQAILDRVDVLVYSFPGGRQPYDELPSLALFEAYYQGIFVVAPAGDKGPEPGSVDHLEPWVTTVGATAPTEIPLSAGSLSPSGLPVPLDPAASPPRSWHAIKGEIVASSSGRGSPDLPFGISKPDLVAPGTGVLGAVPPRQAVETVSDEAPSVGTMSGTAVATAHVAGAAALLKSLHRDWAATELGSALMLTAGTSDLHGAGGMRRPGPFDAGSGRLQVSKAASTSLTLVTEARHLLERRNDLWNTNYPSIFLPSMPGRIGLKRALYNPTSSTATWTLSVLSPPDLAIDVPDQLRPQPGDNSIFEITVDARTVPWGEVRHATIVLEDDKQTLHLPLSVVRQEPDITLTTSCKPVVLPKRAWTDCTIEVTNTGFEDASITLKSPLPEQLRIVPDTLEGAVQENEQLLAFDGTLSRTVPSMRLVEAAHRYGYVPLASLGVEPLPCPDDCDDGGYIVGGLDFDYLGIQYDQAIWSVNGTLELGTSSGGAAPAANGLLPDPVLPNNLLAPWWTDLDLSKGGQWYTATLSDSVDTFDVFEWRQVPAHDEVGTQASFQIWLRRGSNEAWFTYGVLDSGWSCATVGLEDSLGLDGQTAYCAEIGVGTVPQADFYVDLNSGAPGQRQIITFTAEAVQQGSWWHCPRLASPLFSGEQIVCVRGQVLP
jgi:subtilisin family serine protease